ncbi:uncharacterized protein PG986_004415 [Apiospora aurea]|uniref:Uncharacterized protein n=1 Tax=Apiospora aurea TaxID=335848 RepID=A0ABR1QMW0_9PEZI
MTETPSPPTTLHESPLTSILALTTPFLQPPDCSGIFTATRKTTSLHHQGSYYKTVLTVAISDPTNVRFTTCQPPGWAEADPHHRFEFSPAVCPDKWTAYNLNSHGGTSKVACCARPVGLNISFGNIGPPACIKSLTRTPTSLFSATGTTGTTTTQTYTWTHPFPEGIQMHNPYKISWQATDMSTLSPTPPTLTCSGGLYSWDPGEAAEPQHCNDNEGGHTRTSDAVGFWFGACGARIIVAVLLGACVGWWRHHVRRDRKEEKARRAAGLGTVNPDRGLWYRPRASRWRETREGRT